MNSRFCSAVPWLLAAVLAGTHLVVWDDAHTPTSGAWEGKSLQVESQWASGDFRPEYTIPLDHPYANAGDVKRPLIETSLGPIDGQGNQVNTGRVVSVSCNGEELISSTFSLSAPDMRIQFLCYGTKYRVRFAGRA